MSANEHEIKLFEQILRENACVNKGESRGDHSDHATKVKFSKNARKVNWKKTLLV